MFARKNLVDAENIQDTFVVFLKNGMNKLKKFAR